MESPLNAEAQQLLERLDASIVLVRGSGDASQLAAIVSDTHNDSGFWNQAGADVGRSIRLLGRVVTVDRRDDEVIEDAYQLARNQVMAMVAWKSPQQGGGNGQG